MFLKLLWNKVFQKEDDELGWLLDPYKQSSSHLDATMMTSFGKNFEASYQCNFDDASTSVGGRAERVTIYTRGILKRGDTYKKKEETKSMIDNAFQIARYMGMGVYMTSSAFPSPFLPVNDANMYDETFYGPQNMHTVNKIW